MKFIERSIQKFLKESLNTGKIIVLYGARQVGKTTLVKEIIKGIENAVYYSCDDPLTKEQLERKNTEELRIFTQGKKLVVFDEAQRVENIGITLKLLHDTYPELQILATGSSSFDLANKLPEPLTGRAFHYLLLPLSLEEIACAEDALMADRSIEPCLVYGSYPEVLLGTQDRAELISTIATQYLFKDLLVCDGIRKPDLLEKLLKVLAASLGSEVSYSELSNTLSVSRNTILAYITYLEQAFIIFRVSPYFPNIRSQVTKKQKIYFYDLGIRNALLGNFNPLALRNDLGALWENFVVAERKKYALARDERFVKQYFWRTYDGQEVDLVEEWTGQKMHAFEMKYHEKKRYKTPPLWKKHFPKTPVAVVTRENYRTVLIEDAME